MIENFVTSVIVPIVSASIASGGLIFTGLSYRNNTKAKYLQVLREFDNEISEIEMSSERNHNYPQFAARYLNIHERLAFLAQNRKIPSDLAGYYNSSFSAALGILNMKEYQKYIEDVENLTCWCKMNGIEVGDPPESFG